LPKPTLQEYQEAIQRPDLCFKDGDLKNGKPVSGVFGLPKVISGGFAGVFQIKKGNKSYAARCFLRDVGDIEKRYKAIQEFLKRRRIPYFVKFEYIDQGILVKGKKHPILKMEWLDGQTLGEYVEKNRRNSQAMEDMAQKFKELVSELKKRQVSHCDLHDQNIMVVGGELKMIDYDAMFVPGLEGYPGSEVGHTNYQHPERRLEDFGPHTDNFSEWVIYISLIALARRPDIWEELRGGDQCLLFRSTDYSDPDHSKAFRALENIPDDNLKLLLDTFKDAVYTYNLQDIPSIVDEGKIVRRRRQLVNKVAKIPQISMDGLEVTMPRRDKSWIWANKEVERMSLPKNMRLERLALAFTLLYTLVVGGVYAVYQAPLLELARYASGIPVMALLITASYLGRDVVRKRDQKASRIRQLESEIKSRQEKIRREVERVNQIKEDVNQRIKELKERIVALKNQEELELKKRESTHWSRLQQIAEAKKEVKVQERNERYALLKEKQRDYIAAQLSAHRISGSKTPGLGLIKSFMLARRGIRTAADFVDVGVWTSVITGKNARFKLRDGRTVMVWWVNQGQVDALRTWRSHLEDRYESNAPTKLSQEEEQAIKNKYKLHLNRLEEDERKAKEEIQREKNVIRDGYTKRYDSLREEIEKHKQAHDATVSKAKAGLASICDEIEKIDWEIKGLEHELEGYESITFTNYVKKIIIGAS
jgi:serine/threonine protein kinase